MEKKVESKVSANRECELERDDFVLGVSMCFLKHKVLGNFWNVFKDLIEEWLRKSDVIPIFYLTFFIRSNIVSDYSFNYKILRTFKNIKQVSIYLPYGKVCYLYKFAFYTLTGTQIYLNVYHDELIF